MRVFIGKVAGDLIRQYFYANQSLHFHLPNFAPDPRCRGNAGGPNRGRLNLSGKMSDPENDGGGRVFFFAGAAG